MSKLQNLNNQIEKAQEEIRQKENRIKELVAKQKAEEKKARNHRLCKRNGLSRCDKFQCKLPILEIGSLQILYFGMG